ncbi:MAG TPA: hypothetical protein VNL15_00780 [Dehalococcoidia bacterium]|nr:hypothetical protein [Dehalococcoidia bacterium]
MTKAIVAFRVDDYSEQGRKRPTITEADPPGISIDVYADLLANPANISTPIVQALIGRWMAMVESRHLIPAHVYKAGRTHLGKIGGSLLVEAAEMRAVHKKKQLLANVTEQELHYLDRTIALLQTPEVRTTKNWEAKCAYIRKQLIAELEASAPQTIPGSDGDFNMLRQQLYQTAREACLRSIGQVLDYALSAQSAKKTTRPGSIAWRTRLTPRAVSTYISELRKGTGQGPDSVAGEVGEQVITYGQALVDVKEMIYPDIIHVTMP